MNQKKLTREELLKIIKIDIYLKKINFHPSNRINLQAYLIMVK